MVVISTNASATGNVAYTTSFGQATARTQNSTSDTAAQGNSVSDQVTLSPEGKQLSQTSGSRQTDSNQAQSQSSNSANGDAHLSEAQQEQITKLKARDQEVRTHEQAHLSAAGQYAVGGASFSYQQGPDGKRYAVGGEVPIDISDADTPEATLQKMATVQRAALAPARPSGADRRIAAEAAAKATKAREEITQEQQQKLKGDSPSSTANSGSKASAASTSSKTSSAANSDSSAANSVSSGGGATNSASRTVAGGYSVSSIISTYELIGAQA